MQKLHFPNRKRIRSEIVARYMRDAHYPGAVIFSCGNAARELRNQGVEVLEVGPSGPLEPRTWWSPEGIHACWPHLFDATSGHLPITLMVRIAKAFHDDLGPLIEGPYDVPTGSGETIICLRWAYPWTEFYPVYDVGMGTEYNAHAPLNSLAGGQAP